tara:strand:+ start:369 stop:719 length:351 start_codon:yes stop_codon:yes gene_type:complete
MAAIMKTRSGRVVKSPRNEYTDREYVAGSGFVGADHYDRNYDRGVTIDDMKYKSSGDYDAKDGFVVDEIEEKATKPEEDSDEEEEFEDEPDEEEEGDYEGESDEEEETDDESDEEL